MTLIARGGKYQINVKQPPLTDLLIFVRSWLLTLGNHHKEPHLLFLKQQIHSQVAKN